MQIILAKTAGFCFGVKRAVEKVYSQIETGERTYTYGPIIHNEEVVKDLENKGVCVIEEDSDLSSLEQGTVVIRSHGVAKSVYESIEKSGLKIVDATCPFVLKIHKTVEQASAEGKHIIIIGNDGHPEVEGIKGWCSGDVSVISSLEDAKSFAGPENHSYCVVGQTTFNLNKFKDIVDFLSDKYYNLIAVSTICSATEERQTEAREIAASADTMIVIGGRSSSNSRKLYEICCEQCDDTHFIQTLDDLHLDITKSIPCVGITAGASTPNNIIEEVQNYVRINF